LGVIAGADENDPTALQASVPDYLRESERELRNVRIGLDERYVFNDIDRTMTQTVRDAIAVLRALGAQIKPVQFPDASAVVNDWAANCAVETAVAHEATYPSRRAEYGPGLAGLLDSVREFSAADYQKILLRRSNFAGRLAALFETIDLLVVPAQFIASPTTKQMETLGRDPRALHALLRFTAPFSMSGSPTITLTSGFTSAGTPVAFQLVSRHLEESLLVRAGRAYQRETNWHRKHPQL